MTNECRMTLEQWTALVEMFDARGYEWAVEARAKARRLLVEPEQAEIHDGPCVGGPLDGMVALKSEEEVCHLLDGLYVWQESVQEWHWGPEQPADPDLTTFGELRAGECMRLVNSHPKAALIKVACPNGSWNAVGFEEGESYSLLSSEPVRRLPKPEWSK